MPRFTYKALKESDRTSYEATVEAKDRFEVYNIVRKEGGQVVSVKEAKAGMSLVSLDIGRIFSRVKENDKVLLTRNLGAMLKAGLSLSRALGVINRQSKKAKLKEVVTSITKDIEQGSALSEAMLKYPKVFSNLITSMVRAGEESGTLSETLATISDQLEKALDLKKKIKGAMIYPMVIISVLGVVGALMLIFIVPTLTSTFTGMGVALPMSTQIVISLSDFLIAHTVMALVLIVASIVGFRMAMHTPVGRRVFEMVFLHIPLLNTLMKESNSARTGRTLASLLASGVSMLTAIEITRDVIQNSHYKDVLDTALANVQQGKPLADVFAQAEHLYPPLVGELIAVGEETGALPDMLREVAQYYEREVEQKTKNMSTIIEPFLMLIVGAGVGFFAVSMISPIYSITTSIQ
ncbi:MAG: type II secretion system F family protein [Candidatus Pacebacteria bacterium]|nr:type II secretion system F family protein [Candidatus Paceibacterota bacterium]